MLAMRVPSSVSLNSSDSFSPTALIQRGKREGAMEGGKGERKKVGR